MQSLFLSVIGQAVTVALIVVVTRWLYNAKGAESPRISGTVRTYGIKWRLRVIGYASTVFCAFLLIIGPRDDWTSPSRWPFSFIFLGLALMGLWFGSGLVKIDDVGIKKTVLWHSRFIQWSDVAEIRLHEKKGIARFSVESSGSRVTHSTTPSFV